MKKRQWSYKYYLLAALGILLAAILITACGGQAAPTPDTGAAGFVTVTPTSGTVAPASATIAPMSVTVKPAPGTVAPMPHTAALTSSTATPTPTVKVAEVLLPSRVRCESQQVWAGPGDVAELPWLIKDKMIKLDSGGLVTTDANGEGWVDLLKQEDEQCMRMYIFQNSELLKSACPKSDYPGNASCLKVGTGAFNNSCASEIIIQTLSADIKLEGTWVAVTYLPEQEVTVAMVFNAEADKVDEVKVWPAQQLEPDRILAPSSVQVLEEQFWFTTPGDTADPIAGLEARVAHPFDRLLPLVEELDLWPWIDRIKLRADGDNVPYPNFPPFGPTATPIPPAPIATVCGPPAGWVLYVVQTDDTLFSLANKTRSTVEQIQLANCMAGGAVYEGQRLYLPFTPATPTPIPTPCGPPPYWVLYVVQTNDTLFSLANKTQTTIEQIKLANCLVSDAIFEGQRLYLPFEPTPPPIIPEPVPQLKITAVEFFGCVYDYGGKSSGGYNSCYENEKLQVVAELTNPYVPLVYDLCPWNTPMPEQDQDQAIAVPITPTPTLKPLIRGIRVIFNRELYPQTVNKGSFQVSGRIGWVDVDPMNNKVARFQLGDASFRPETTYTVTLRGNQDKPAITDLDGNRLDGEPYGLPSGDGIEGGNFVFDFSILPCSKDPPPGGPY